VPALSDRVAVISVVHSYRKHFALDESRIITRAALFNWQYVDWLVAVSEAMKAGLTRDYGLDPRIVHTVYNGSGVAPLGMTEVTDRFQGDNVTVFFGGGLRRVKGWRIFWKALNRLERVGKPYSFLWSGADVLPGFLVRKVRTNPRVVWLGLLDRAHMLAALRAAHMVVMPSRVEGCPMLLLEAMAMGVVPVVSDCPSAMREIVREADCGCVVPTGDARGLSRAIERLAVDRARMRQFALNAVRFYSERLHIGSTCQRLLELASLQRAARKRRGIPFPPPGMRPWHRGPYAHRRLDPRGVTDRFMRSLGVLPRNFSRGMG
jgi:glycosyltransferase involved in cell wall biosynthesis